MNDELAKFRSWGQIVGMENVPYPCLKKFFPELYRLSINKLKELENTNKKPLN